MIEGFASEMQKENYQNAFEWIEITFSDLIEQIIKKTPIITSDYDFVLVGDFLTSTFTQNSEIDIFIAFGSPQLELNSIKLSNDRLKRFWIKLKKAYTLSRQEKKKKKKRKKNVKEEKETQIPANKYTILDLKKQLAVGAAQQLDATSSIFQSNNGFKIVARNHLGIDINIYPVIKSENSFKVYSENSGNFLTYNFSELEENINKKIDEVGEIYFDLVRAFKNLYFNVNSSTLPSLYLIESLIYNCPNSLFSGFNFYEVFIKILNYLTNVNIADFVLINKKTQKLFTSITIQESIANINNFIKKIDELI
jgi:hypothetical protein